MELKHKLAAAGIQITSDRVNVEHLRFDKSNQPRASRFENFQRAACRLANADAGTMAARLIGFELVAPSEILWALNGPCYTAFESSYLEWEDPESTRLDRRRLSALTLLSWRHAPFSADEEWRAFQKWLTTCECYSGCTTGNALFELELDLIGWSVRNLPMALWGHVCRLRPMHGLSRTTLARQVTGKVPATEVDAQQVERESLLANLIDSVDFAKEKSQSDALLRDAIKILSNKSQETPSQTIARWTSALLNLQTRAENSGMASTVVLSWMADTIESGTARKQDADHKTLQRYCRVAALPLWRMLAAIGGHPDGWQQEELEAGYLSLMIDESTKDKLGLGAAISSFQVFLYQQWDVPIAARGLHKYIPAPHPRVQLVTQVEVARVMTWIASQDGGDTTLLGLCQIALALGSNAPLRIRELLHLRRRNLAKCLDGSLEIEIVRLGERHRLKTPAAVRRVHICDKAATQLILDWDKRRELEGATTDDLLFAVQDAPQKIYRQHVLHRTLLWALKAATGEPDMTFHALRHSWASRQTSEVLQTDSIVDFNRLIHIADAMGHVSPDMTLRFYAHVFEDALHFHTLPPLFDTLELNSIDAQNLIGLIPNTIRQQARRWGVDLSVLIWRGIDQAAQRIFLTPVAEGLSMVTPQCPHLVTTFKETLTPLKVLAILVALENGQVTGERICARFRITPDELTAIESSACRLTKDLMATSGKYVIEVSGVRAALEMLGINLTRANQARYAELRDFLELPIEAELAADAAASWTACRKGIYFSAARPEKMEGLLRLFSRAGLAPSNFVVQIQYADSGKVDADILIQKIAEQFVAVLGAIPTFVRPDCDHPARPMAYLTWPAWDKNGVRLGGAAAQSNGGLYALLFAVGVLSHATLEVACA